jgi:hypothetical protein
MSHEILGIRLFFDWRSINMPFEGVFTVVKTRDTTTTTELAEAMLNCLCLNIEDTEVYKNIFVHFTIIE